MFQNFHFGKKKKKTKKFNLNTQENNKQVKTEANSSKESKIVEKSNSEMIKETEEEFDLIDFDKMIKKPKKTKKGVEFAVAVRSELQAETHNSQKINECDISLGVQGSEHDYAYDELFDRIFSIMKEKNPAFVTSEKTKFILKAPQVLPIGTRRTSLTNFGEICSSLHRPQEHLMKFFLIELGTIGSLDTSASLTVRGRFKQSQIENVLKNYFSKLKISLFFKSLNFI